MDTRRDFLKKAALIAAGGGVIGAFPASIQRALAIDPAPGTTFLDAEHVVILMQENRSFDHCYGSLRGVRGFNDPRAVTLPDGNPVWFQTNKSGETYGPFRLNIRDTKATWIGSLPHSWVDQTDARNGGKNDGWLEAKRSGHKECAAMPITMGFYNRDDLPFYYALADAFTVCDQNFCSSLTGTTPNRLYLWTGTIREKPSILAQANVRNENVDYGAEASWKTFPERLEDNGVSWKIYQNEISLGTGFQGEEESWLANFTDNPIEWFTQFRVRFSAAHRRHLAAREKALEADLPELELKAGESAAAARRAKDARAELEGVRKERAIWTDEAFEKLTPYEKSLHSRAFTTNEADPHYRELDELTYQDGETERRLKVPKGDVLHQFRTDVREGKLPTVSWVVAPENFSDHPGAPWYGAWYFSEVFDILTQNPEVWKKTVFILCYDENDGYFDHIPPFVPPHHERPDTGKVSAGIDTSVEQVRIEQERERQRRNPGSAGREGPIGLGFRVPLVIASPWSRGGYVNSQVCDHTSILQLLEQIVSRRSGKQIRETNISQWRRTVCGDLSSVFRPYNGEKIETPPPVQWKTFAGSIHQAQFRQLPHGFKAVTAAEIAEAGKNPDEAAWWPRQEKGIRPACALPYDLSVDGTLSYDRKTFTVRFSAAKEVAGKAGVGAPFHVYSPAKSRVDGGDMVAGRTRAYAVIAGDRLEDTWKLSDFEGGAYHLRAHGPNGFYREFRGNSEDPVLDFTVLPASVDGVLTGNVVVQVTNRATKGPFTVLIKDASYGSEPRSVTVAAAGTKEAQASVIVDLAKNHGWYDLVMTVEGAASFARHYAGHVETGRESFSDPLMGREVA